jgi:hypothetical protein
MASSCTVCGTQLMGHPDDDVTCSTCEQNNFAGDLLRHPPQGTRWISSSGTRCWWLTARGDLAPRPRPDVPGSGPGQALRSIARADAWRWSPERGDEETPHA